MKLAATKSGIKIIPKVKRESFLPADEKWLSTHSEVKLGKFLGEGTQGSVYTVKGKPSLVIKIPVGYNEVKAEEDLDYRQRARRYNLYQEIEDADKFGSEPLIIPSKATTIKNKHGFEVPGIIRPRVRVIADPTNKTPSGLKDLTDVEIEQLRQKVISLSEKGILLKDGLQVGRDRQGRIQLYDIGNIEKYSNRFESLEYIKQYVFDYNQNKWRFFLHRVGIIRYSGSGRYSADTALKKYGKIEVDSKRSK